MRKPFTLLFALAPLSALAGEGMLGTKAGAPMTAAAPGGSGSLITTVIAIGIVVTLLKVGLPKIAQKLGAVAPTGNGVVIKSSNPLNASGVHVIEVQGRTLLVGSTAQTVSLLADLTADAAKQAAEAPEAFMDIVEKAPAFVPTSEPLIQEPVPVAAVASAPAPSNDLLARLDRLRGTASTIESDLTLSNSSHSAVVR